MQEAIVEVTTYNFSPLKAPGQTWTSKGEVIKFDGFMKLYIEGKDDEDEESTEGDESLLPAMKE